MRDRSSLAMLVGALVVFASLSATLPGVWKATAGISDVPVYERYGDAIERGRVPYRDFRLEYPPGALAAFAVPSLVTGGRRSYARVFALEMLVLGLAAICACFVAFTALGLGRLRLAAALAVPASAPLLLGPLVLTRFDLYPAALTALAVAAVLAGRERFGAGALGAAVAVKLYPAVLVPLVVALAWRRHGRRRAAIVLGVCALVTAVVFLPFLAVSPGGVAWSVRRQLDRPLQIESLGSAVLLALHHAAGMPLAWASSHGSQNLTGTVASVAAAITTALQIAALGYVWWRFAARSTPSSAVFGESCLAALLVFVALGKVLSPQFLVWLLPVAGLLAGRRFWPGLGLIAGACALTRGWFPSRYWRLVFEFDGLASWLVLARDLLLVALLVLLLGTLTRFAPQRSP